MAFFWEANSESGKKEETSKRQFNLAGATNKYDRG
jgi:hypothetical protein